MLSSTSTQLTFSENDGIKLEIMEPNPIVLVIPEKTNNAVIPLQIQILISNNSSRTFPYIEGALTPELLGEDEQVLLPLKLDDNRIDPNSYRGMSIPTRRAIGRSLKGKLFWQNNLLQLETTIDPLGYFIPPKVIYYKGIFSNLQPGIYQLRFTYSFPKGEFSFFDSSERTTTILEVSQAELLATPWTPLRLIEPVKENENALLVDGICFETIVPEKIIKVPLSGFNLDNPLPREMISVDSRVTPYRYFPISMGMKITNNTSIPYRFIFFDSLIPSLKGEGGLIPCIRTGGSLGLISFSESDFYLAMPSESVTLDFKARLEQQANGLYQLVIGKGAKGCWFFNDIKLGTYQIQLTYRSLTVGDLFEHEWINFPKDAWKGKVSTPFVEFHLLEF